MTTSQLDLPDTLATPDDPEFDAAGPFAVRHNGRLYLGSCLCNTGPEGYTLFDGSKTLTLDPSYVESSIPGGISFFSEQYQSRVDVIELSLDMVDELYDNQSFSSLADFVDFVRQDQKDAYFYADEPQATTAAATPAPSTAVKVPDTLPDDESLYVTEDDNGNVVDLVYSNATDVYLRATDGTWAPVQGDGTDSDPIDGRVIEHVNPSYVRAYDAARASDDPITDADIEQYRTNVG